MGIRYELRGGWSTDDDPFPKTYRVYDTGEIEEDDADRNWDDEAYKLYTELVDTYKGEREWRITLEDFEKVLAERRKTMEELKGCVGQEGEKGILGVPLQKERGAILDEARKIINGVRNDMYGKPEDSFDIIAKLWSLYLQKRYQKPDSFVGYLSPQDVAIMMAYMKMARITAGHNIRDSFVDCCGYLGIAADMGTIGGEITKKLEGLNND